MTALDDQSELQCNRDELAGRQAALWAEQRALNAELIDVADRLNRMDRELARFRRRDEPPGRRIRDIHLP